MWDRRLGWLTAATGAGQVGAEGKEAKNYKSISHFLTPRQSQDKDFYAAVLFR